MKALVVYYSRTGITKKVAEELAKTLRADLDEVKDMKKRDGILGYIVGGFHGLIGKLTEITYRKNPEKYDLIIIGSPIWAGLTPAIRTYLIQNKEKIKKVSFFCTRGGSNPEKVFSQMENLAGKPIATLALLEKEVKDNTYKNKIRDFCKLIKK